MIHRIREKIHNRQFEFSKHAVDQSILRHITLQELYEAIENAQIIEDYPDDKYGPTCLLLGFTKSNRPLHIQCSYPERTIIKIITLYQLDPKEWDDYKIRKVR